VPPLAFNWEKRTGICFLRRKNNRCLSQKLAFYKEKGESKTVKKKPPNCSTRPGRIKKKSSGKGPSSKKSARNQRDAREVAEMSDKKIGGRKMTLPQKTQHSSFIKTFLFINGREKLQGS